MASFLPTVTADPAREPQPPRRPSRPSRPAPPAAPSPPPARPPPPATHTEPPLPTEDTADFLNLSSGSAQPQEPKREKKLKSDDSFDFFGMMEKQTDDGFGDFLTGNKGEKAQVS